MANLRELGLEDILPELPDIKPLDAAGIVSGEEVTLYICVLGFEPRSLTVSQSLVENGFRAKQVVCLEYGTNVEGNASNRALLMPLLRQISADVTTLEADVPGFGRQLGNLLASLRSAADSTVTVLLDISVAANRIVMRCMGTLLDRDVSLKVAYSEAAIYHPTRDDYEKRQAPVEEDSLGLESGIGDVAFSEEYPGYHLDPLPDCVIVFPSYNRARALTVVSRVDPLLPVSPSGRVIWLLGVPHSPGDRWRLEAMRSINGVGSGSPQYEVSTFEYKEAIRVLDGIYAERAGEYNMTLSPMGSKLQAVGCALFCFLHPDVRVVFATPQHYNAYQYSAGCKAMWMIDFGNLNTVRSKLSKVGSLELAGIP